MNNSEYTVELTPLHILLIGIILGVVLGFATAPFILVRV